MDIYESTRKDKRLMAVFDDGTTTHFGLKGGNTYIDHGDKQKRDAYIARHKVREDWSNYKSAGSLAKWILWGTSTDIRTNIASYKKRFNLNTYNI